MASIMPDIHVGYSYTFSAADHHWHWAGAKL